MKFIKQFKLFESVNEQDIDTICKKYNITNYTINSDGTVDVDGDVHLTDKKLEKLPLMFGKVTGYFNCSENQLVSLHGSPHIVGFSFNCSRNQLKTLEGGPQIVKSNFFCNNGQLESLKGAAKIVGGSFQCNQNRIKSLKEGPESVGGDFECSDNLLISLEGVGQVNGYINCSVNDIESLNGCTLDIKKLYCGANPIYKWWNKVNDIKYLDIFLDMNIHADDPDEINQEKIDIILNK